jgi:hypothetical protein
MEQQKFGKVDQLRIKASEWLIHQVEPLPTEQTRVSLKDLQPNQEVILGQNPTIKEKVVNHLIRRPNNHL